MGTILEILTKLFMDYVQRVVEGSKLGLGYSDSQTYVLLVILTTLLAFVGLQVFWRIVVRWFVWGMLIKGILIDCLVNDQRVLPKWKLWILLRAWPGTGKNALAGLAKERMKFLQDCMEGVFSSQEFFAKEVHNSVGLKTIVGDHLNLWDFSFQARTLKWRFWQIADCAYQLKLIQRQINWKDRVDVGG